ncbi:MAG TPA: PA0069 family radical SAM protein [bacterium]|nr:PA0069 family radical SAM protein [bacterium]
MELKSRGTAENPANRFEKLHYGTSAEAIDEEACAPTTEFFKDTSKSVVSTNDSPDLGFIASVNPYRGCEHGCIYCYARPSHEYLGFSAGLDFESKIMVKEDAPALLRKELMSPKWEPKVVVLSGNTDCYQPIERKLRLTRRCLEVLVEFRNPVAVITKNALVIRDLDLLGELARFRAASVAVSVTTLDDGLRLKMEPRASSPERRLETIRTLADAGIPVTVMTAPIIPGLNDHEIPRVLEAASKAGATSAGYVMVRLAHGLGPLFEDWLERNFPDRKEKVLHKIRDMRGGKMNDSRFGVRQRGEGVLAKEIADLFRLSCRKLGLNKRDYELSAASFRRPGEQIRLFG